jgi:RNA polymerase sigma-70 factor (ECF subfamily)
MAPNPPQTQALIDQARNGAPRAVDMLLGAQRESLRRMIALRLNPALAARVDASDVVQDVLLEASQRLQDYLRDPAMPFHLWLRTIARDHMIDAHRRHCLAQRRSLEREQSIGSAGSNGLMGQLYDHELTPAAAALRQEMQRRLQAVLTTLDEDDRDIILMKHFEQMPNQEIAAFLGLSEPAASMRYLRAIRKVKALLHDNPSSEFA